ncbi:MAG: peptidoglycan bridge formation glycyltransferase FemA/FemB family protein [Paracoccaceae bacterium]
MTDLRTTTDLLTTRSVPAAEWPTLAAGFRDLSFEQSLTYASAAASRIGARVEFVVVERAGQPVAAAAVRVKTLPVLGRGIAWIPAGPLTLPNDALAPDAVLMGDILQALRRHFTQKAGHILRLRLPGLALHDPKAVTEIAAGAGFTPTLRAPLYRSLAIDLHCDTEALMQNLNGKWRTDLRYAQKSGLTLEQGNSAGLQARFLALFETVQAAKGFRTDITPEFHFGLSGPDYGLDILIATKDGQDVGGIVIGTTGRNVVYLFGATAEAGRSLRAGYFLTWEGIALSRRRRLDWYDLGGIDYEANPDVARFKDRMNGTPLLAQPFEARPAGLTAPLIGALESLRARIKRR